MEMVTHQEKETLEARLAAVEQALRGLAPGAALDLGPLLARLDGLEGRLAPAAVAPLPEPALATPPPRAPARRPARVRRPARARRPGANLLSGPRHGKPDDLKLIVGVAEKLERLLHRVGVFYFWQIAEWTRQDVKLVDDRLEVFRGRIDRDRWVKQSRALARLPGSARRP